MKLEQLTSYRADSYAAAFMYAVAPRALLGHKNQWDLVLESVYKLVRKAAIAAHDHTERNQVPFARRSLLTTGVGPHNARRVGGVVERLTKLRWISIDAPLPRTTASLPFNGDSQREYAAFLIDWMYWLCYKAHPFNRQKSTKNLCKLYAMGCILECAHEMMYMAGGTRLSFPDWIEKMAPLALAAFREDIDAVSPQRAQWLRAVSLVDEGSSVTAENGCPPVWPTQHDRVADTWPEFLGTGIDCETVLPVMRAAAERSVYLRPTVEALSCEALMDRVCRLFAAHEVGVFTKDTVEIDGETYGTGDVSAALAALGKQPLNTEQAELWAAMVKYVDGI